MSRHIKITPSVIDQAVIYAFNKSGVIEPAVLLNKTDVYGKGNKRYQCDARRLTFLLCREHANMSYREIAKQYKRNHAGVIRLIQKAIGYRQTDHLFLTLHTKAILRLMTLIRQKEHKQKYNAHYRLRQKGFDLSAYDKTIYLPSQNGEAISLNNTTEMKMLRKHGYSVQITMDI